ncbi:twin-arginine translocase subunit TatC [Natronobeatus ordinarius]|uniref:twin-arginine translocase subunit TatC n=1 Tax=Natronobeatus ordinarius TaxID=2963433 RepID=UPI0020CBA259|nr:twin-arginine translocase subunit TatC [Natronobeatus ordinarius]
MADESDEGADAGEPRESEASLDEEASQDPDEWAEAAEGSDESTTADDATDADSEPREAKTDGEGLADDLPERDRDEPTFPDPDDDIGGISTPPDDEEMPLADHIEEMILRLAVVLLVGSAFTAIGLLGATEAIDIIWSRVFPAGVDEPAHIYYPLELWLTRIKVAALLGIIVALPVFVYQCYLFMRPGLYPHERKYYLAAVPTSVVLAGVGMLFSFVVVLPILFSYFTFYAEGSAEIAYALGETFGLIITLTGFLAIVFQIPLFIMLAIMMGVTTRAWLAEKRLYFWAAFFGLAFMFTVDPTMMAPIIVAIVMILLFEGTLLLLKWTGRE